MENPAKSNFDRLLDRTGTDSLKWARYTGRNIISMWVADMDFQSPQPVLRALKECIDHGIFGYAVPGKDVTYSVVNWLDSRHQWKISADWIVWLPGLVTGLNVVCRAFSEPGEQIATCTPVYPPFLSAPVLSDRKLVRSAIARKNDLYTIDLEDLGTVLSPQTKVLLFCSPHNPVGRVWTKQQLQSIAQLCLDKDCILCSDEIHADLILDPARKHIPIASLSEQVAQHTVTLGSPSKAFNLPGLNCSYAIIPNERLRNQFVRTMEGIVPHVNALGYVACRAAYTEGADWLAELLDYLRGNRDMVTETIDQIPALSMAPVEATYLAWIDCRQLGLPNPAAFFEEAGVGLSDGAEFDGPGFVRLNFACPRSRLQEALNRIKKAVLEYPL